MFVRDSAVPQALEQKLADIVGAENVRHQVSLRELSRWRIGGNCWLLIRPRGTQQVAHVNRILTEYALRPLVIGHTTNLLFADDGLSIPIVQILGGRVATSNEGQGRPISCAAGVWVPALARAVATRGLSGIEHVCGIPGTMGGLVAMNGGSQRKSISTNIHSVTSVDFDGRVMTRGADACEFGYRESIFQRIDEVITEVEVIFNQREVPLEITRNMRAILRARRLKFPHRLPNCGSVFKADPHYYQELGPPGKIIENLGLRGLIAGGAAISRQHGNFINNLGQAKAVDVLKLVEIVCKHAFLEYGIRMRAEAKFVQSDGMVMPLDEAVGWDRVNA